MDKLQQILKKNKVNEKPEVFMQDMKDYCFKNLPASGVINYDDCRVMVETLKDALLVHAYLDIV